MSRWITSMMVDDCLHDPVLGAKVLLGYELPPNQKLRLRGMWNHKFMIDSSGYGTGKSLNIAIAAGLRCMLMRDRVAGIISKTFGQGKLIYSYFDAWIDRNPIFRSQIKINRLGEPMSLHGSDAWVLTFTNGSLIRVIPPAFMTNSERVASESWTDGYYDEWVRYGNYDALRVLMGRVRKPVPEQYDVDDPIFDHHLAFFGTADYTWHPAYSRITHYLEQIALGSPKHDVQSWNYEHYPARYHRLIELDVIENMKATMTFDQVEREVYGRWVKDSAGYYSARDVADARKSECRVMVNA